MTGRNDVVRERKGAGVLGPALERRPATDAVAIMEPDGCGLEDDVWRIALAACLVARKTLQGPRIGRSAAGKPCVGSCSRRVRLHRVGKEFRLPEYVRPHHFHEILSFDVCENLVRS